jgi:hypothetical protein
MFDEIPKPAFMTDSGLSTSPPESKSNRLLPFRVGLWLLEAMFTLALIVGPSDAFAQSINAQATDVEAAASESPIVTDRPTDSASPLLLPKGTFQIETGYKFSRFGNNPGHADSHEFPDLLARFAINHRFEARLFSSGWTLKQGSSGKQDGFSDITLGTKIALADAQGHRPQMGLLVDVSMPVGHSDITNDYVIPRVLFLGGSNLTDRLALTYNLGPRLVTTKSDGDKQTDVDLNYAVALSGATGTSVSLFGEIYGAFASGDGRPNGHTFQAGATLLLNPTLQLDIRGGFGLVDSVPDWLFGVGIAFRLPY